MATKDEVNRLASELEAEFEKLVSQLDPELKRMNAHRIQQARIGLRQNIDRDKKNYSVEMKGIDNLEKRSVLSKLVETEKEKVFQAFKSRLELHRRIINALINTLKLPMKSKDPR